MPIDITTTRSTEDDGGGGGGTAPAVGGGGGVSDWDDLTGELSGPVPFDAPDGDGNPTSRSIQFLNVQPQVDVTSDPANGIALEIKDQTNGNRLGTLTTDGRWETRGDQEAFADGSFPSGSSTNSLLQVEEDGNVLTTDAASLDFTGDGVSLTQSGDEITVDVSGGSDVGALSDLTDVSSAAQGNGNVLASGGGDYRAESIASLMGEHVALSDLSSAQHSSLGGISADDHHAVFEPADYNPVSDVEAHGNALTIDITGDADTVDGYEGSELAALAENETVTGTRTYNQSHSFPGGVSDYLLFQRIGGTKYKIRMQGDALQFFETGTSSVPLHLGAAGNVGIGTTSPSYTLEVSGDVRATGEVEAFLGSDRRLKADLDPVGSALDKVDQLTGYGFDWRDRDAVQPHKRGETDVGLIAQEVEDVLPEAVKTFSDGHSEGFKSVSYDKLVPLLVEAIKDLRSQVQTLQ